MLLPGDIIVPLGPEEPHLHLHLSVQVAEANLPVEKLLVAVLLHLPDGVEEEKDEDRDEDIEIVEQLGLKTPEQAGSQHSGPHSNRE